MNKSIRVAISCSLLLINFSMHCSLFIKRNFASDTKKIAHNLTWLIKAIQKDDPSNMYMQEAEKALKAHRFGQADNYIRAHYCNKMLQEYIADREQKEKTNKILQAQIKDRLKKDEEKK